MVKREASTLVILLLYSNATMHNTIEQGVFLNVKRTIDADPVLRRLIRCINVDHREVRNYMRYNSCGVSITHFPVFTIRYPRRLEPTVFPICYSNFIFEQAHKIHEQYIAPKAHADVNLMTRLGLLE